MRGHLFVLGGVFPFARAFLYFCAETDSLRVDIFHFRAEFALASRTHIQRYVCI